jgi:hypothetical protein
MSGDEVTFEGSSQPNVFQQISKAADNIIYAATHTYGGTDGTTATGGYKVSLPDLNHYITEFTKHRDKCTARQPGIQIIRQTSPPAEDPGSLRATNAIIAFGDALKQRNDDDFQYLDGYVVKLTRARDDYLAREQAASTSFKQHGRGA